MEPRQIDLHQCRFHLEVLEARIAPGVMTVTTTDFAKVKVQYLVDDNAGRDGHGLSMAEVRTPGVITWDRGV